jgi:Flp pilus assembly protein TadG
MAQVTSVPHRRSRERGAELIEFALVLPLILILLMGIFDFGLAFQRYEIITNAAREGARLASLQAAYTDDEIRNRALSYCTQANLTGCVVPAPQRGGLIDIGGGTMQQGVRVTVQYTHNFAFVGPILSLINGSLGSVNMQAVSTMRSENQLGGGS